MARRRKWLLTSLGAVLLCVVLTVMYWPTAHTCLEVAAAANEYVELDPELDPGFARVIAIDGPDPLWHFVVTRAGPREGELLAHGVLDQMPLEYTASEGSELPATGPFSAGAPTRCPWPQLRVLRGRDGKETEALRRNLESLCPKDEFEGYVTRLITEGDGKENMGESQALCYIALKHGWITSDEPAVFILIRRQPRFEDGWDVYVEFKPVDNSSISGGNYGGTIDPNTLSLRDWGSGRTYLFDANGALAGRVDGIEVGGGGLSGGGEGVQEDHGLQRPVDPEGRAGREEREEET